MVRKVQVILAAAAVCLAAQQASSQSYVVFPGSSGRVLAPGELSGLSCQDLWVARNEIFYRNGYCFKTPRGRSFFSNDGCRASRPNLNRVENANVANIKRWERQKGC